jgi:hypothetical protein
MLADASDFSWRPTAHGPTGHPQYEPNATLLKNIGRCPTMPEELRQRLKAWYAPHEQALEAFLASLPTTSR